MLWRRVELSRVIELDGSNSRKTLFLDHIDLIDLIRYIIFDLFRFDTLPNTHQFVPPKSISFWNRKCVTTPVPRAGVKPFFCGFFFTSPRNQFDWRLACKFYLCQLPTLSDEFEVRRRENCEISSFWKTHTHSSHTSYCFCSFMPLKLNWSKSKSQIAADLTPIGKCV